MMRSDDDGILASASEEGSRVVESSEVVETMDLDCADEMVMRLAIADSFFGPSYDKCISDTKKKWFAPGGKAETMMAPKGGSGGGSGFSQEQVHDKINKSCVTRMGHGIALGPRLLRMTFHDAADFNNLRFANGTMAPASMGGVDSCLHTALLATGLTQQDDTEDNEEIALGEPNHNRGLSNAEKWVMTMSQASKLSRPDIQVLGASVALEAWMDGPEMGATYGRKQGKCSKMVCSSEKCWHHDTPFFVQPVAEPVGGGMFCPMTNTLQPLQQLLNMTLPEMVALQGSHSVGGVIVCSGLGNVAKGPYCPQKCGIPPGNFFENGNLDGTVFDDTPGKLDNRYYQLLMNETYEDLPACKIADPYFPQLSARGLSQAGEQNVGGSGGKGGLKDLSETCQAGVPYESENACEVEDCAEKCTLTDDCIEAENVDSDDVEAYKAAVQGCNGCKAMCSSKHRRAAAKPAGKEFKAECRENCTHTEACKKTQVQGQSFGTMRKACDQKQVQCVADADLTGFSYRQCSSACNEEKAKCFKKCTSLKVRKEKNACKKACNQARQGCIKDDCQKKNQQKKACRQKTWQSCMSDARNWNGLKKECNECQKGCNAAAAAHAESIYNASDLEPRPARWCKRLSGIKQCLDPDVKLPVNGGWGDCPEDKRIDLPNLGNGRLTIIQNMERWTTFRGLHKRIMVLPSDWSWLGKPETKALFRKFGTDEDDWKLNFVKAFKKLSTVGWGDSLKTCNRVVCAVGNGTISCPVGPEGIGNDHFFKGTKRFQKHREESGLQPFVRPTRLDFKVADCEPASMSEDTVECELTGGFGVKARLSCDDGAWTGLCITSAAADAEARIAKEWESGGKTPQCDAK